MNSTASRPLRVLIAEDEPEIRDYLEVALRRPDCRVDFAENGEEVLSALAEGPHPPDLVILDVLMPVMDGMTTLREIRQKDPSLPVLMLSGASSTAHVVEAIKSGANNFLTKPVSHEVLRHAVDQLLRTAANHQPQTGLSDAAIPRWGTGNWSRMLEPLLERISGSDAPVLLQGETGSGKEVLARLIHSRSLRSSGVFLKLNCAALPSELVESELFGYERGAFTGAFKTNPGKFELADGGTIFLDEIGDMDFKLQAKLLQVLQDHEFLRLGARESTRVDVRVIAATHCDLQTRIEEGTFREDLYYRLNVINITIPPLRERRDEIIPLATSLLRKHNPADVAVPAIGAELKAALMEHQWPGNIRELENVMRRFLVIGDARLIAQELKIKAARPGRSAAPRVQPRSVAAAAGAPPAIETDSWEEAPRQRANGAVSDAQMPALTEAAPANGDGGPSNGLASVHEARKRAEIEVIMQALNSTLWNRKRAAAILGVDYKALLYKMKKLGIGS